MKHVFHMKADFINGATAIMATPEMRWCDLGNWVYCMGIREYRIIAVDDEEYQDRWRHVTVDKNQNGKEVIILGGKLLSQRLVKGLEV